MTVENRNTWRMGKDLLEIPRAYPLSDTPFLEIRHHLRETVLWHLFRHGFALDGLDLGHGGGLEVIRGGGEGVDMLEDVDGFGDGEGFSVQYWSSEDESREKIS